MADYHNLWALYSSLAAATTSLLLLAAALLRNEKRRKRKTRCAWVKNWHRTEAFSQSLFYSCHGNLYSPCQIDTDI